MGEDSCTDSPERAAAARSNADDDIGRAAVIKSAMLAALERAGAAIPTWRIEAAAEQVAMRERHLREGRGSDRPRGA